MRKDKYFIKATRALIMLDITGNELKVLLLLMLYGYSKKVTWTSKNRMAEELHMSKRTIENCLYSLRDKEHITISKERKDGAKSYGNIYRVSEKIWGMVE